MPKFAELGEFTKVRAKVQTWLREKEAIGFAEDDEIVSWLIQAAVSLMFVKKIYGERIRWRKPRLPLKVHNKVFDQTLEELIGDIGSFLEPHIHQYSLAALENELREAMEDATRRQEREQTKERYHGQQQREGPHHPPRRHDHGGGGGRPHP